MGWWCVALLKSCSFVSFFADSYLHKPSKTILRNNLVEQKTENPKWVLCLDLIGRRKGNPSQQQHKPHNETG
tara:strand:- start:10691 stop:10906 length:216 start_codon:yes stop_codon:yes gene_type:complete